MSVTSNTDAGQPPMLLTVEQAAAKLGIGRTTMYGLVSSGAVESVGIGRLRRVPAECLTDYVNTLRRRAGHMQMEAA